MPRPSEMSRSDVSAASRRASALAWVGAECAGTASAFWGAFCMIVSLDWRADAGGIADEREQVFVDFHQLIEGSPAQDVGDRLADAAHGDVLYDLGAHVSAGENCVEALLAEKNEAASVKVDRHASVLCVIEDGIQLWSENLGFI
eukprot:GHVR01072836.1.p1 GENE.GHVR01072836.1~~GHVR01072836.1.p1  ORF type:complete len:145 (-),score=16.56 GHVR01072836.1:53-487(-)